MDPMQRFRSLVAEKLWEAAEEVFLVVERMVAGKEPLSGEERLEGQLFA